MRNIGFKAIHRGGTLNKEQHIQLMKWACQCAENVFPLLGEEPDERLKNALLIGGDWASGNATVGAARKAALMAIAVANESSNPVPIAIARATAHAVATAHMADHSLGAALYALKAVNKSGKSVDSVRKWQNDLLPSEIKELVFNEMREKEKHFKL